MRSQLVACAEGLGALPTRPVFLTHLSSTIKMWSGFLLGRRQRIFSTLCRVAAAVSKGFQSCSKEFAARINDSTASLLRQHHENAERQRSHSESTAALRHCLGSNMRALKRISKARLLTSGNAQLAYCEYCSTTGCT